MNALKKLFLSLSLIAGSMLNMQAADQSWGSYLRNLGSQAQQRTQRGVQRLRFDYGLEPLQQWTLGTMGTIIPTALWHAGFMSGKKAAFMSLAALISAYLLEGLDAITLTPAERFTFTDKSQQLLNNIKNDFIELRATTIRRNQQPIQALLESLEINVRALIPFISLNSYQKYANVVLAEIIEVKDKNQKNMITLNDAKNIVDRVKLLHDIINPAQTLGAQ